MAKYVEHRGDEILTGIFKEPVSGPIALSRLNLAGDEQADLSVHGGPDKAVYAYPSEHYPSWREELPDLNLPWGAFGENLTTAGLMENNVCIGDEFQIGTAVLRVSQPRLPCYKLAIRLGRPDVIKRFMKSGRSGIYFSVVEEGVLQTGDGIKYLRSDEHKIKVLDVAEVFSGKGTEPELVKRIMQSNLADQMKESVAHYFSTR